MSLLLKHSLCLGMLILAIPAQADLQQDLTSLRSEKAAIEADMRKLDTRIAATDSATRAEQKRSSDLSERYQVDLAHRRTEIDSLNSRLNALAAELQRERSKQNGFEIQIQDAKARRASLAVDLAAATGRLEAIVARSLPWERDSRLERIRSLRRDLESGTASPDEGFSRLRALYSEETRFGDEVALMKKSITRNDGELINAKILRLGNQWMVYADEDNKRFGILQRSFKGDTLSFQWKEDLNFDERQAVLTALDVKDAKKPPQFVTLPLSLTLPVATGEAPKESNSTPSTKNGSKEKSK